MTFSHDNVTWYSSTVVAAQEKKCLKKLGSVFGKITSAGVRSNLTEVFNPLKKLTSCILVPALVSDIFLIGICCSIHEYLQFY